MKKTLFTALRAMCVGAMTLFAVSCYDDSALWNEVDRLDGRIDSLANALNSQVEAINTKIAAVETAYKAADADLLAKLQAGDAELATSLTALTAKLDALDGTLDGYIESNDAAVAAAIEDYKKADTALAAVDSEILAALAKVGVTNVAKNSAGNAVLTFTDGSTLEVAAYDANANNTGLVTVVEEEGVKYWAVVLEDGTTQNLGVAVGHLELKFKVDYTTNALLYSVDNGANWNKTGAYVASSQYYLLTDLYIGGEMNWETYEYEENDYYTIVFGGEEYYLPIYKTDNSVVTIKAGKTFFAYGESKTIDVAVTDVAAMYVMTKPDGWRANLDGKKLTVTAPSEANVTSDAAEADGEVLLHCTTVDGNCKIARLAVATSAGFSLTVDEEGNVTIVNPFVVTTVNDWTGMESTDFQEAYVGLAEVSAFEADPAAYVENAPYDYSSIAFTLNIWKSNTMDWDTGEFTIGGQYVPGEYETDVINTTVAAIHEYAKHSEPEDGARFVVWACPVDELGNPNIADLVYGYYASPVSATITEVESSCTDVELSVEVLGSTTYYVGLCLEEYMYGFSIDDYMLNSEGPFGYFQMALNYGMADYAFQKMGTYYETEGETITVTASELNGGTLLPNSKFYAWVFPVIEGLDPADYTYEDNMKPYIYEFTTTDITSGGTAVATFGDADPSFTSIKVPVTAEDAVLVYYNFYDADEYNDLTDVSADLRENGYVSSETEFTAICNDLDPDTKRVLAALVVDSEGRYGEVVEDTYSSLKLVYSETFKATVGDPVLEISGTAYKVNMPVTVEGGTAAKYYYYWNSTARTEEQLSTLPLLDWYYYFAAEKLPVLTAYFGYYPSYQFAVVVESTDGEFSAPVIVTVNKPEDTATE